MDIGVKEKMKSEKQIEKIIEELKNQKASYGINIPKFIRLQINNRIKVLKWVLDKEELKPIGSRVSRKQTEYDKLDKIKIEDFD